MIRPMADGDRDALIRMIKAGVRMPDAVLAEQLGAAKRWVYNDGEVRGCAVSLGRSVALYVEPGSRGRGIGGRLWEQLRTALPERGPVFTRHLADYGAFFRRRGFAPVVDLHLMGYSGRAFSGPELAARPYEDGDFAEYIRINNAAFADLRREAGIDPLVYPEGAEQDPELRARVLAQRDSIWMLDGVGLLQVDGAYIETVAVDPACQGRGYGLALTRFAVNRIRERGADEVLLDVGAPNLRARRLYERLGFVDLQVLAFSRLEVGGAARQVV